MSNDPGGARNSKKKKLRPSWHVVGDSHARALKHAVRQGLVSRPCKVTAVGGATAVGLRHPNSQTNALNIFKEALFPVKPGTTPVIQLGEVDCGFVIWYRAAKYGESIESQLNQSIEAYFKFVDELLAGGYPSVVITGAILPTIGDGQEWGEIARIRREVTTTLRERTDLTLEYNEMLRKEAKLRRLPFIEITDKIMDKERRIVSDYFRHPDPLNHHLDPGKAGLLWATELNRLGSVPASAEERTSLLTRLGRIPRRIRESIEHYLPGRAKRSG